MPKKLIILLVLLFGFQSCQIAQKDDLFTIYLVRHSEKDLSSENESDPPLPNVESNAQKVLVLF